MLRRLMIGLAAGALLAAMLPGVASGDPTHPQVMNFGMCVKEGYARAADPHGRITISVGPRVNNKNGTHWAQGKPFDPDPNLNYKMCAGPSAYPSM